MFSLAVLFFAAQTFALPQPQGPSGNSFQAANTIRVGESQDSLNGATACDIQGQPTFANDAGIVGLDPVHFGRLTDIGEPTAVCGKKIKLINPANGNSVTGTVRDRVRNFQNPGPGQGGHSQVDISPDLNIALGGNGKDNLVDKSNNPVLLECEIL